MIAQKLLVVDNVDNKGFLRDLWDCPASMYMSTLLLFLSMPLVLGSALSFVIMLLYIPIIAKRIRSEE